MIKYNIVKFGNTGIYAYNPNVQLVLEWNKNVTKGLRVIKCTYLGFSNFTLFKQWLSCFTFPAVFITTKPENVAVTNSHIAWKSFSYSMIQNFWGRKFWWNSSTKNWQIIFWRMPKIARAPKIIIIYVPTFTDQMESHSAPVACGLNKTFYHTQLNTIVS